MKRLLRNLLWLLVLIACSLSPMPAAAARSGWATPSPQLPGCSPNLQIESVKYLGHDSGKDSVQVVFNGLPPTNASFGFNGNGGFNPTAPSCATYGVPSINNFGQGGFQGGVSNNLPSQQVFGGNSTSQNFGYELTVTITR